MESSPRTFPQFLMGMVHFLVISKVRKFLKFTDLSMKIIILIGMCHIEQNSSFDPAVTLLSLNQNIVL